MNIYAGAENIITSLGFTARENAENIMAGASGIKIDTSGDFSPANLPLSVVDHENLPFNNYSFTPLERMLIASIQDALDRCTLDITSRDTLIIITSTKGNIDLLGKSSGSPDKGVYLSSLANTIGRHFRNPNTPLIISNACVSGVVGLIYGERLIRSGKYKHVLITGGDLMSEFIVSGFLSFQSLSMQACKPFDKKRDGLTLGEGCGTIILSADQDIFKEEPMKLLGGAGSNDANHISGPSRTGEGLQIAIRHALEFSGLKPEDIDYVSAHGTATDYNDEMEAKAFSSAGLGKVPLNSYKGYFGHTLGAAGVIESALCLQAMRTDMLFASAGYVEHGVTKKINIIKKTDKKTISTCLKTASGFGGSNAAVVFQKI